MVEIGNIITLENNVEYLVTDDIVIENKRYVLVVKVLEDEKLTNEYLLFEVEKNNEEEYLLPVEDKEKYDSILTEMSKELKNKTDQIDWTSLQKID